MRLHLQWNPRSWLLAVALFALVPAMLLWAAALGDSLGFTRLLTAMPTPSSAPGRPERLLLQAIFLGATLGLPVLALLLGVLSILALDLQVSRWEVVARLRLPAPPWTLLQIVAAAMLLIAAALFLAIVGHLAADCLFGMDCISW